MQLRLAVDFQTRDDIVVTASLNEKKKMTKKLVEQLEGSLSIPICSGS